MEVKDLSSLSSNKIVYCTMEVDGGDKLQTDQAEASKPWSAVCSFLYIYSTLWAIKKCHFYFNDNFGKRGPISIILSLFDS